MSVEGTPSAARYRELIRREDETLRRVTAFISEGVAGGRISAKSAELLTDAATARRNGAVRILSALLSDRLREEWQA